MMWTENINFIEYLVRDLGLKLEYIQSWHLRISRPGSKRLDYFPKSGRATWVGTNKWFEIEDVEAFLLKEFHDTTTAE